MRAWAHLLGVERAIVEVLGSRRRPARSSSRSGCDGETGTAARSVGGALAATTGATDGGAGGHPTSGSPGRTSRPMRHGSAARSTAWSSPPYPGPATKIRLLTRIAFGFHSARALIALAMLSLGGLCPPLSSP